MKEEKFLQYYDRINPLVMDILDPLRISKSINREKFDKFYSILDELKDNIKGEEYIPRKLAGLLFFVYVSVEAEGFHSKYPQPLFVEIGKIESYLNEILWDSPFK